MLSKIKPWMLWYKICQKCGYTNPDAYSYCNGCGAPLS
jgi:ribosomal protein L40E